MKRSWILVQAMTVVAALPAAARAETNVYTFDRPDVLGTTMKLLVRASSEPKARAAEQAAMAEIRRLDAILNTYGRGESDLAKLNAATGPVKVAPELAEVLRACENWRQRTGGAFNAQLGRLIELWKAGEKAGKLPDAAAAAAAAAEAGKVGFEVAADGVTVRRTSGATFRVDALAKGYIVDKAAAAAAKADGVEEVLLAIGGDMAARAARPEAATGWIVGVTDPAKVFDNAAPKARVVLKNAGLATSGNYERFYTIGGRKYSHIFDPRTGKPAEGVTSSTAVAATCAEADAMATSLSVLSPPEGLRLVAGVRGAECLLQASDGREYRSAGMKGLEAAAGAVAAKEPARGSGAGAAAGPAWPAGNQLELAITVRRTWSNSPLMVWVEDSSGKYMVTLAKWGKSKYLQHFNRYAAQAGGDKAVEAVSGATRSAGTYRLVWDGRDRAGQAVPPGEYTVVVELASGEKKTTTIRGKIACGAAAAEGIITGAGGMAVEKVAMKYGPAAKAAGK